MIYNSDTPNISSLYTVDEVIFNNSQYQRDETNFFKSQTDFLNNLPPKLNMEQYNNITNQELNFKKNGED